MRTSTDDDDDDGGGDDCLSAGSTKTDPETMTWVQVGSRPQEARVREGK